MARRGTIPNPIRHSALEKRRRVPAKGKPEDISLPILDLSLLGVKGTRVLQEDGRLRVEADLTGEGLRRKRRYEEIPTIGLAPEDISYTIARREIKGHLPAGVPTAFIPKRARRTHTLRPEKGNGATGHDYLRGRRQAIRHFVLDSEVSRRHRKTWRFVLRVGHLV